MEEDYTGPKRVPLEIVLTHSTKGKKGNMGVSVRAALLLNEDNKIELKLQANN
jgi:hypothetical protein